MPALPRPHLAPVRCDEKTRSEHLCLTYLEPRKAKAAQHFFYILDKPVRCPSHSLTPLVIGMVRPIEHEDWVDWKAQEMGAVDKDGGKLWVLGVAMVIGCAVEPATVLHVRNILVYTVLDVRT